MKSYFFKGVFALSILIFVGAIGLTVALRFTHTNPGIGSSVVNTPVANQTVIQNDKPEVKYSDKLCTSDAECGGFPCVDKICFIKKCTADDQCPNKMCGLHLTPVPGYCTTTDVY